MKKMIQCVFLISMLPGVVCAHAPLKIQDFSAISTNDWSGQTNSKMLNNHTNKSFNHGTKNNPFTQKELINKFNQTVNIEYTTVNKYDTLGIRPHRLRFEYLPNWIKNAIPKKSEEEKRKFWQQAYIIIVQDDINNGLEVYPISKNHFYQGYTQISDIRTLEQSHPRLWSKIENHSEIMESIEKQPQQSPFVVLSHKQNHTRCIVRASSLGMEEEIEYWFETPFKKGGKSPDCKPQGKDPWFFIIGENDACIMDNNNIKHIYQAPPTDPMTGFPINWRQESWENKANGINTKTAHLESTSWNSWYKPTWSHMKIGELFLIGAHDAGTGNGDIDTFVCPTSVTRAQKVNLKALFESSVRYFDIRANYKADEFVHDNSIKDCYIKNSAKHAFEQLAHTLSQRDHEIIFLDFKHHISADIKDAMQHWHNFLQNKLKLPIIHSSQMPSNALASNTLEAFYKKSKSLYPDKNNNIVILLADRENYIDGITYRSSDEICGGSKGTDPKIKEYEYMKKLHKENEDCSTEFDKQNKFCRLPTYYDNHLGHSILHTAKHLHRGAVKWLKNDKLPTVKYYSSQSWHAGGILYFDGANDCYDEKYNDCGSIVKGYNDQISSISNPVLFN